MDHWSGEVTFCILLSSSNSERFSTIMPHQNRVFQPTTVCSRFRWIICGLLFFATTINYIDRQILSLLKPILDDQLGWTSTQFGAINSAFQAAYGISLFGFGWFIDR